MNKDILMLVHNNTHSTSRIFRNIELIRKTEVSDEVDIRLSRIETACIECREQVDALYEIFKTLYTEEQLIKLIEDANYDGQSLHAKSVTYQMMRANAEAYSNEIIQSLKK
jgi:hypothetical protein